MTLEELKLKVQQELFNSQYGGPSDPILSDMLAILVKSQCDVVFKTIEDCGFEIVLKTNQ